MIEIFPLAADPAAVIRLIENNALALVATMPTEAHRLVVLASMLRERPATSVGEGA